MTDSTIMYPKEVARAIATLRAEPKDPPEKFIGRDEELQTLMAAVHGSIPTRKREGLKPLELGYQAGVLQIITGGPGAGKTSLLKEIEDKCRYHGCRVIHLQEQDLENPTTLSKAIREKCHWWGKETLTTLGREVANTTAAATDAMAGGWIRKIIWSLGGNRAEPGSDLEADRIRPARAVLQCWQKDEPADPTDVLRLLSALGPTVLTIDEGHQLDRYLDTDRNETAKTIIRTIATPKARHEAKVDNCFMVAAGLNDLHPTITNLGTFRQTPFQLGTMREDEARAVIEHWIDLAQAPEEATRYAKAEWVSILAREFGQWPHHTIGAAMGARAILETDAAGSTSQSWGIQAVREIAENYRNSLYGYVSDMAVKNHNPLETVLAVVHAMAEYGGTMTTWQVEQLVARALEVGRQRRAEAEPTAEEKHKVPSTAVSVRTMFRAGVLEYADIKGAAGQPTELRIAVPSLSDYLRAVPMEPNGPAITALQQMREERAE